MDVYTLSVQPKDVGKVCLFLGDHGLDAQPALKHLKRVKRDPSTPQVAQVLLCPVDLLPEQLLTEKLIDSKRLTHIPVDIVGSPQIAPVPAHPSRTHTQMKDWTANIWPVALTPVKEDVVAKERLQSWSSGKVSWMRAMCERVLQAAEDARQQGEQPIACIASESWDPARHSLGSGEASQPIILASAHDTRTSTGSPLSHAVLNLLEGVAHLDRTDTRPALADSNYLLTNLTAFMTHEPCLLCSMALLHSRISCLLYIRASSGAGGCGSEYSLHEQKGTNHHFEAWCVKEEGDWQEIVNQLQVLQLDP